MNSFNLLRVIKEIYYSPQPNLDFIQSQGLLAVKLGQIFALRLDFLNETKCQELSKLYRQTTSLPAEDIKPLLQQYTQEDFLKNFSKFDTTPLASASVGQVHAGTLLDGTEVVVKIIKKTQAEQFTKDVLRAQNLFKLALIFQPRLRGVANPVALLAGIEKTTLSELNLLNEIAGQTELLNLYQLHKNRFDLSSLNFVKIHHQLSNANIMVSQRLHGPTFDELIETKQLKYDTLLTLFKVHGFYMFGLGIFHGDLHPGNIFLENNQIYFVDTGYIGRASERLRRGLFYFFKAMAHDDYPECAKQLNQMADNPLSGANYKNFQKQFLELYSDFPNKTVSEISLTKKMMQTIRLGVLNGLNFNEGMFDIIKSLMYLDGMVIKVNPDAMLIKDMKPFIQEFESII